MFRQTTIRVAQFGGAFLLGFMLVAWSTGTAQPPGRGDTQTVRGTVREFTTAPMGEVDGLILNDGTVVHWPPHLQDRFTAIALKGTRVEVTGWTETGPAGDTKVEVATLTNLRTAQTRANDDRSPPPGPKGKAKGKDGPKGKAEPFRGEFQTVRGTVKEFTKAPMGEVDGLILTDGTWVHWPPHLHDRFIDIAAKGDRVRAAGFQEIGPAGDTKLEVSILTNLVSNKTGENPDRPAPASARLGQGKTGDVEERLQLLEDKMDQLIREIERLKRN